MRCAAAIIDHPFYSRAFDERRRVYKTRQCLSFPCVDPIMAEAYRSDWLITSDIAISLSSDERAKIDSIVSAFVVYAEMRIFSSRGFDDLCA
jgi:hypothetical protein